MRRRDFISLAGGTAVTWPLVAHAQQPERMRRLGVLSSLAETDTEAQAWDAAFRKRLAELGWIDGRSVHIDSLGRRKRRPHALVRGRTGPAKAGRARQHKHSGDRG